MIAWSSDPQTAERQMQAVIFCLVAFGYIDSDFDRNEKAFVRDHIRELVEERAAAITDTSQRADVISRWHKHYDEVMDEMDRDILCHFTESVVEGESTSSFVLAKLKLGAFELLKGFGEKDRAAILHTIDELMHADGVVHPNEQSFRDDLEKLLEAPIQLDDADLQPVGEGVVEFLDAAERTARIEDHPLLRPFEWDFASDPETFAAQAAGDLDLFERAQETWAAQRLAGAGKLDGVQSVAELEGEAPFLDGHVYVAPHDPHQDAELLVLGDLHGCYSCLKAALMQADFIQKVEDYKKDPTGRPKPYLVLLGDYIDRGRFSYAGILRAIMQLFTKMPDHVFVLRGNHEYYVEIKGQVLAPVRPCEAMDSIKDKASKEILASYMNLFESLPNMLIFDRMLFVHGGIPRDATIESKWKGLQSLNDKEMRFEMLWSDPSDADALPDELQAENARFPFGRLQFQAFMNKIGCRTMVRGHERVREGFRKVYDGDEGVLCTLFSAGGEHNEDLPATSNYREVTPMALSIRYQAGVSTFEPFVLDYARYNRPETNAFFKTG